MIKSISKSFPFLFSVFFISLIFPVNPIESQGAAQGKLPNLMASFLGDYDVTFTGRVGGSYEPSDSIISGSTKGLMTFATTGTITLAPAQSGVIAIPEGKKIPGVNPQEIIFGATVIQNPLHIFLGTPEATRAGDFGIHSMMQFGVPEGTEELKFTGCTKTGDPFNCVPMFLRRSSASGRSVNLVYFTIQTNGTTDNLTIKGELIDRHIAESAAVNLFSVPITSPILGDMNDSFMFSEGATFEITVSGKNISGNIQGKGTSVAQLVPQTAIFEATFNGIKRE